MLLVVLGIGLTQLLNLKSHEQSDLSIKPSTSLADIAYANEVEESATKQTPAWDDLTKNGYVVNGKIKSEFLDVTPAKTTRTIVNNPVDLTNYIKYEDRTEGNDIEGIFSDLRVKWASGTDYYDTKYLSRDESADGDISGNHGDYDCWIVKLTPDTLNSVLEINQKDLFNLYPNPTTGTITIERDKTIEQIQISDINGRIVKQSVTNTDSHGQSPRYDVQTIDLSNNAKGIYFVKLIGEHGVYTQKIVLE